VRERRRTGARQADDEDGRGQRLPLDLGMASEAVDDAQALHQVAHEPPAPDHAPEVGELGAGEVLHEHLEAFAPARIPQLRESGPLARSGQQLLDAKRAHPLLP
jgi:hypothetical protein